MTVLHVDPDAPRWMHIAATTLLTLHIGGGSLGILSGTVALLSRKGAPLHRAAGSVFFAAMLTAYAVAAGVSPFLDRGQWVNTIAAITALYLLISGWLTVKRGEDARAGTLERTGLVVALAVAGCGALINYLAAKTSSGTIDGSPPQAAYVFVFAGTVAAAGELNVILRGGIAGAARVARHLWRMCFSLFIAAGSFFLGQQQVMPEWLQGSPILVALALAPLGFLAFWLFRVRLTGWFQNSPAP